MDRKNEEELHREEGRYLLNFLTQMTKQRKLCWTIIAYLPLLCERIETDEASDIPVLQHAFSARTVIGGRIVLAVITENLTLEGKGRCEPVIISMPLTEEKTDEAPIWYTDIFSKRNVFNFVRAMLPLLAESDIARNAFTKWPPLKETDPDVPPDHPILVLGQKLLAEQDIQEFHRVVWEPAYLSKLLEELTGGS